MKGSVDTTDLLLKYPVVLDWFEKEAINALMNSEDSEIRNITLFELEKKLFPLKFSDLNIPCYIIPIKPYWASQLFDKISSNQTLFGSIPEKIWSWENVYYRSVFPVLEMTPGRILWYASDDKSFQRKQSIVGTSYIDDVVIDFVKPIYNRFKRFGIYQWEDVCKQAGGSIEKQIKAIRFSNTEVYEAPVPFNEITEILLANNYKKNTFASPLKISNIVFNQFYSLLKY